MRRTAAFVGALCLAILFQAVICAATDPPEARGPGDVLYVSGVVTNAQGRGIKEVGLTFYLDGNRLEAGGETVSSDRGTYEAVLTFPPGTLPGARLEVEATRASYKGSGRVLLDRVVKEGTDARGGSVFLARRSLALERTTSPGFWFATLVLVGVYALIALEIMHRTLAALLGAALMLFVTYAVGSFHKGFVVLTFQDAMKAIDMNVIFLLMAMMIIVGVMKKTGVFQWIAYKSFQLARGNVFVLSAFLMFITAVTSAFLDNVTTMLLIIPVTVEVAVTLKINPVALLLPEVFASNVGGTATLIGDPPNIMIGSYANLSFMDFVANLGVICLACLAVSIVYYIFWFKKGYLQAEVKDVSGMIQHLREEYRITDGRLLVQSCVMLGITILLFVMHGALHMEPSIAAMVGAAVLMAISRVNIVEMLEKEIEWPTLIFFMMLFIVVAGAEETGLIQIIADWVRDVSQGSLVAAILMILWVAAIASAIIDNIPFTATMLPIVAYLTQVIPGAESGVLWWALALGACLGGNGTMIGASANVVTVGMAERAGYPISFMEYARMAFVPMLITIVLCTGWLLLVEI